jgi:integrase/recombinase XerC
MGDQEAIAAHLAWLRLNGAGPLTVTAREGALARMAFLMGCPLLEASADALLAWRAGLQLAPNSVLSYLSHARQFYAWAAAEGLLDGSPAKGIPAPRRPRQIPRPIAEDDLMLALATAPARIRPWLVLAGWAGLRAKEIALLRREHVLEGRPVPILRVAHDATKGYTERLVPISTFVAGELRPLLPRNGWVFPRLDGRPGPLLPARVSHVANAHLHDCGTTSTLHSLRHRFATQAYAASRDLRAVQELLGHAAPETTAGYAAYHPAAAAAAVEAIPAPIPRELRVIEGGCT